MASTPELRHGYHRQAPLIAVNKLVVGTRYEFANAREPTLGSVIDTFLAQAAKTEKA